MNLRMLGALVMALAATIFSAGSAMAAVPTPNVTGPVPVTADSYPFLATDIDLSKYGYVEEEYFITGEAYGYDTSVPYTSDAPRITTGPDPHLDGKYPFKTRMVVRRPANPADANGKAIAEWNNVTAFQDIEFNWLGDPHYMLKHGYTFVGVTAQIEGVNSLKTFDNTRYGDLTVNGNGAVPNGSLTDKDALSYDIFASALKAVQGDGTGVDPLGGINPDMVIASGESQSCSRLSNHHNKIEPTQDIVDAYLLTVCTSTLRTDRPEKVIRIITETENRTERTPANFPDTTSQRHWEVAGASHLPRMAFDNLNAIFTRDGPVGPPVATCTKFPLSLVPWPYTQNRAIDALVNWVKNGEEPPIAPRGQYNAGVLVRDAYGIAQGAIRYPEVTVPVGVNDGINSTGGPEPFSQLCILYGSNTAFDQTRLHSLYFDYADYITKYAMAADAMIDGGFILPEDVERLKARSRQFADLRPSVPAVDGASTSKGPIKLTWQGTEAPDTQFEVERTKASSSTGWKAVMGTFDGSSVSLKNEPEGTHRYRVRNTTVIPGTNISPPRTTVTPYSEELAGVKVDRSGPKTPKVVIKGKKVKGKKGTYKGKVTVKVVGKPDAKLPDGSAGVGLNGKSVPKPRKIKKKGRTVIKVKTRDKLGNASKAVRVVVKISK